MITYPLANANASVIAVTGTASYILPLIDTAGSVRHAFPNNLDAINITPEDGDIRIFTDNTTAAIAPTASKGFLIRQGSTFMLRRTNLRFIKAIATSGTVSCSVEIGSTEQEEFTTITGGGGGTSGVTSNSTNFTGMVNRLPRAIYNASPTARTEGQGGPLQADSLGNLQTNANTLTSGESQARNRMLVVDGGTSTRITTAATTVCRNTTGRLNGVYVEVALTGTATFYDNASAASGTTPWILPIGTVAGWHEFRGATMSNGVVCVTSAADRLVVNTDA